MLFSRVIRVSAKLFWSAGPALLPISLRALEKAFALVISLTSELQLQLVLRLVHVSQQVARMVSPQAGHPARQPPDAGRSLASQ
eukprot:4117870-Pyramimonas_sp.AAC.1